MLKLLSQSIKVFLISTLFCVSSLLAADYTNSIGMQFKNIPAGTFFMGSCKLSADNIEINEELQSIGSKPIEATCPSGTIVDDKASDNETPQHKVTITRSFQIGIYEVTVGEFQKYIEDAGRHDLLTDKFIADNSHGDATAVTSVSWYDARDFMSWLNKKENTRVYRLPTEAEWEYIARAGTDTLYSWGNQADNTDSYAWYYNNTSRKKSGYAHQVGQKQANPWDLYDVHGNVWEWVTDWYSGDYYKYSTKFNPNGRGAGRYRVNRGGSWFNNLRDQHLRSANRGFDLPAIRSSTIGFRVLREQAFPL